jgi:glycosyltransferase involved in cell wall biosynthesis
VSCLTEETEAEIRRVAPGVDVRRVPNPIPIERGAAPASATSELVLFAGEVGQRKGVDVLIEAWPAVRAARPEAWCLVVGPSTGMAIPEMPGLDVRGPVSMADVRALMRDARVVVLPSRAEAMPMVILEAMSLARPFVATPVGQVPDLAVDDGALVPVGDADALSSAIVRFLEAPDHAEAVGIRGQDVCARRQGVEVVDAMWRAIYADCVGASRVSDDAAAGSGSVPGAPASTP